MNQDKNAQLKQDIEYLGQLDQFGRFLGLVKSLREASFAELQGASVEQIKEVVGRITAYDGLLAYSQFEAVDARMRGIPLVEITKRKVKVKQPDNF